MIPRFERNYELTIQPPGLSGPVNTVIVRPPLRIAFDGHKSINGGLNKLRVKIYNLAKSTRLLLPKDAEDQTRIPITLKVGYQKSLEPIFKGTAHVIKNAREGTDIVTEIECLDGGVDFLNSFSSRVAKVDALKECLADMPNTAPGRIRTSPPLVRPKVMVGNTAQLIDDMIDRDAGERWFIDDEQLFVLKANQVTSMFAPEVSAATGLLSTPTRENKRVTFQTQMNPSIRIGGLAALKSTQAPHLNGVYRVETIGYSGDYAGSNWSQTCTGMLGLFVPVV